MIDLDDLSKIARLAKRYEQRHEATLFNSLEIRKNDLEILFNEENEIKTNQEEDTRKDNRSNDKKIIDLTKLNIKNFQLNTI